MWNLHIKNLTGNFNAKQKQPGCKKVRDQSEAAL